MGLCYSVKNPIHQTSLSTLKKNHRFHKWIGIRAAQQLKLFLVVSTQVSFMNDAIPLFDFTVGPNAHLFFTDFQEDQIPFRVSSVFVPQNNSHQNFLNALFIHVVKM